MQPAEPLDLWDSPPFEPTMRDGKIFARGSVDDKGQLFLHIKALEAHLATRGTLPVNIIVLAEGEEEVGSENLAEFIEAQQGAARVRRGRHLRLGDVRARTAVDSLVAARTRLLPDRRAGSGDRSALGQLRRRRDESRDGARAHSRHDARRRRPHRDRRASTTRCATGATSLGGRSKQLPFDDEAFREETGSPELFGEKGYSTLERLWMRPTCEVNGLLSGYTGEGAKTVLPAKAMAKVSCRLVPDQTPEEIEQLMRAHVERVAPQGRRR